MVETVTIQNTTPNGPTLEEEAAQMDAAVAAQSEPGLPSEEGQEGGKQDRPEWLPEKFKSPEDMAKAYAELEKKLGQPNKGESQQEAQQDANEVAEQAVESAGLNMEALSAEYAEKGELTPESYEALEKVGISKDMVDQYIAGVEAQQDLATQQMLAPVGGEQGYQEMISWAADSLSEAEIDAYNKAIDSGDAATMKMAVENLHNRYIAENGSEPKRMVAGRNGDAGLSVYNSTAELMRDMQDKRYAEDPAFRSKVEQKLARSNIL